MIINARCSDFEQICKIHKSSLPEDFLSGLSDRFLTEFFYPTLIKDSLFLVWRERDLVKGFLIIVLDVKTINRKLFYNINTLKEILNRFFEKPVFIIKNVFGILFSTMQISKEYKECPEVYLIAVDNFYQGRRIGTELINAGMGYLKEHNFHKCIVKTLSKGTGEFYKKNWFCVIGEEKRCDKKMIVLGRMIDKN